MPGSPLASVLTSALGVALLVVLGIVVLILAASAPHGRKGLVAAGGALLAAGALTGGFVQILSAYLYAGLGYGASPIPQVLMGLVPHLVVAGGLLCLVIAATRRAPVPQGFHGPPPPASSAPHASPSGPSGPAGPPPPPGRPAPRT